MYKIRLSRRSQRYYERVDAKMARRLNDCFDGISKNPFGAGDIKPLKGMKGVYRFRVGELRVVHEVDIRSKIIKVIAILPRGEAYKRF